MMRKTALIAPLLLVTATTLTVAQRPDARSEDPDVVLKTVMTRALVDGDLDAAIARYRDIATRYRTIAPPVAAQALVQMAASYEKLGRPEARAAYEEITRDFADQSEAVGVARARLGGGAAQASETDVIARRIWSGRGVNLRGMPSADGRYLTMVDWSSDSGIGNVANVAVRDLTTGATRVLTRHAADDAAPPVVSPDSTQVAYGLWSDKAEIRLVGIDGTRDRNLVQTSGGVEMLAWSPDGRSLAAALSGENNTFQIVLVSIADRTVTPLKSVGWRFPTLGGFSPDGRFLVYSLPHTPPAADGGIFAIAVGGSGETALVQGPNADLRPQWTPDGRAIVFQSDRSGSRALWFQGVENGTPRGEPRLLRSGIGEYNMGFTRDGTYFYGANNSQQEVYVARLNPDTLEVTSQPSRLSEVSVGANRSPAWSPDGKSIAFVRTLPRPALVIRAMADGSERTLPTAFPIGTSFGPEWFPDGRALLVGETDFPNNKATFRRVEIETGRESVVFETRYGGVYGRVQISRDGQSLYYSFRTGGELLHLMKRDLASGTETELYQSVSDGVGFFGLSLSPDGTQLAFNVNVPQSDPRRHEGPRALMVISVNGGTPRELQRGEYSCPQPRSAAWTKDGRYVLSTCEGRIGANPVGGGERRPLDLNVGDNTYIDVSLDGRHVAYTGQRNDPEVWVIKNLLPSMRVSQ